MPRSQAFTQRPDGPAVTGTDVFLNKDKPVKPALLTATLIALAGCASTPPPMQADQKSSAEVRAHDCGKQTVRTLKSPMSPRLVVYRACKERRRPDGKASEKTEE